MPSKRTFDLVVLVVLLAHPVIGLAKVWATRVSADPDAGPVSQVVAGATRIVS